MTERPPLAEPTLTTIPTPIAPPLHSDVPALPPAISEDDNENAASAGDVPQQDATVDNDKPDALWVRMLIWRINFVIGLFPLGVEVFIKAASGKGIFDLLSTIISSNEIVFLAIVCCVPSCIELARIRETFMRRNLIQVFISLVSVVVANLLLAMLLQINAVATFIPSNILTLLNIATFLIMVFGVWLTHGVQLFIGNAERVLENGQ